MQRLKYCLYDGETKILSNEKPTVPVMEKCFASYLLRSFDKYGDKIFHTELLTGESWTFRQVKDDSVRIASSLINLLHLNIGDIAFGYAPTSSIYARAVYACIFAGVTFSGELPRLSTVSLVPQLQDCKARLIITTTACLPRVKACLKECPSIETILLLDGSSEQPPVDGVNVFSLEKLIAKGSPDDKNIPRIPNVDPKEHVVFIPYSSGSTGRPKGILRTAHSMLAHSANSERSPTTFACFETFGHVSGQNSLILTLVNGAHGIMIPGFTIDYLFQAVSKFKVDTSLIPPTLIPTISKMTLPPDLDLSSLKFVVCGGASLPATVVDQFLAKFPSIIKLRNTYGFSEGGMTARTPMDCSNYQSIGSVVKGVDVKIVNRESGLACSFNEVGEICMRSEKCAIGYLNRPEAQAETWTEDGWLRTGDAAYYDADGLIFVVDRYKEMIKVHMNQVAPAELQALLCLHPEVSEACVIAACHPETGETPRAFVVPKDVVSMPDEEEILKFVNKQVADFRQINGGLFLVESLPKMVIGKIDRQFIKKQYDKLKYLRPQNKPSQIFCDSDSTESLP